MLLGDFTMPLHPPGENTWTETLDMDIERLATLDELGYNETWLGEHYTRAGADVEHRRQFNAKQGHGGGDQGLKLVAGELRGGLGGGKAYRHGGEEFTLLFPGKVRDEAIVHLNAVRVAGEGASFSLRRWHRPKKRPSLAKETPPVPVSRQLSVTVSIGVSDSTDSGLSPQQILKNADQALYRAKKQGRNRVST